MRTLKLTAAVLCMTSLVGATLAQTAAPAANLPAIVDQIPAGSMGYLVAGNLKAATDNVDKFISDIGLAPMAQAAMPNGMLEMMKTDLKLGEGFNPSGGFAMVMLDPAAFGVDLPALLKQKMEGQSVKDTGTPFVIFLPGKSLDSILSGTKDMTKETVGKFTKITTPIGAMFTVENNGYVLVSPNDKALTAVMEATDKASKELSKDQMDLIAQSDVAIQVNIKNGLKTYMGLLDVVESQAKSAASKPQMVRSPLAAMGMGNPKDMFNRENLKQLQCITITGKIAKEGLIFDFASAFLPDSAIGKALAAVKPSGKVLDRLPDINYVFAASGMTPPKELEANAQKQQIDQMMNKLYGEGKAKEAADASAKVVKLTEGFRSQCTGMQMVVGGAPEGSGLIGAAVVMECKDTAAVKALLTEMTVTVQDIVKDAAPDEMKSMTITYTPSKELGGYDVIDITHPELANLTDDQKKVFSGFLGGEKINILVAQTDGAVVLTLGGGTKFMEEALKAAKGSGKLPTEPGVVEVMKMMPKNLAGMGVFNASNLLTLIGKGMEIVGEGDSMPPIKLTTQTPITFGVGITGSTQQVRFFVPTSMVKEATSAIMGLMGSMMAPPQRSTHSAPPMGGESF